MKIRWLCSEHPQNNLTQQFVIEDVKSLTGVLKFFKKRKIIWKRKNEVQIFVN